MMKRKCFRMSTSGFNYVAFLVKFCHIETVLFTIHYFRMAKNSSVGWIFEECWRVWCWLNLRSLLSGNLIGCDRNFLIFLLRQNFHQNYQIHLIIQCHILFAMQLCSYILNFLLIPFYCRVAMKWKFVFLKESSIHESFNLLSYEKTTTLQIENFRLITGGVEWCGLRMLKRWETDFIWNICFEINAVHGFILLLTFYPALSVFLIDTLQSFEAWFLYLNARLEFEALITCCMCLNAESNHLKPETVAYMREAGLFFHIYIFWWEFIHFDETYLQKLFVCGWTLRALKLCWLLDGRW